jgi:glycosyltransferase involved in cell wall biosynthesis
MSSQTLSILSKRESKKKYNILTFSTHERYESDLCLTGHNFYAFNYEGSKEWDRSYADVPENYYILPKATIPNGIQIDFILAHSKFGQLQKAFEIAQVLKVPIACMEHTVPTPNMTNDQLNYMRSIKGHVNIFNTEYNKSAWGYDFGAFVAPHNVDTELFSPMKNGEKEVQVLSVANDYINRDYCLNFSGWQRITKDLPVRVVGNTPGLSKAAESVQDLANEYKSSLVFLNTSTYSPVPTSLLEAMACGCAVVSMATCEIPKIIDHTTNGFISNNEEELRKYIKMLFDEPELAISMGKLARQKIILDFSAEKFISKWNNIFDKTYSTQIL